MRRREPSKLLRKLLSKSPASIVERGGVIPPPPTVRGAQDRREKHFSQKSEPMTLVERNFFQETGCSQQSGAPRTVERGGGITPPPLDRNFSRFGKFRPRFGHRDSDIRRDLDIKSFEFSVQKLSLGPGIFRATLSQLCRAFPQKVARMWTELGWGVSLAGFQIRLFSESGQSILQSLFFTRELPRSFLVNSQRASKGSFPSACRW